MVRTRADGGARRVVSAKAPRKSVGRSVGGGGSSSAGSSATSPTNSSNSGGNPVKWWPTPSWQKEISTFFKKNTMPDGVENSKTEEEVANAGELCTKSSKSSLSTEEESETINSSSSKNGSVSTMEQEITQMDDNE